MLRASDLLTIPNGAFEDGVAVERTEEFWKSSQKRRLVCNKTFMQLIELECLRHHFCRFFQGFILRFTAYACPRLGIIGRYGDCHRLRGWHPEPPSACRLDHTRLLRAEGFRRDKGLSLETSSDLAQKSGSQAN